jgi:hypothetical protein
MRRRHASQNKETCISRSVLTFCYILDIPLISKTSGNKLASLSKIKIPAQLYVLTDRVRPAWSCISATEGGVLTV